MKNEKDFNPAPFSALIEVFPLCQKLILNSMDFKELGFTKTQLSILFALTAKTPLTMSELSTYIACSKEQATRAVAPLVKDGYLERIQDESNRKLVLVRPTPYGKKIIQSEEAKLRDTMDSKFCCLSQQDQEEFRKAVNTTLEILKKL